MAIGNFSTLSVITLDTKISTTVKGKIFLRLNGKVGKEVEFNFKKEILELFSNDNIFVSIFYNNNCLVLI